MVFCKKKNICLVFFFIMIIIIYYYLFVVVIGLGSLGRFVLFFGDFVHVISFLFRNFMGSVGLFREFVYCIISLFQKNNNNKNKQTQNKQRNLDFSMCY